MLQQQNATPKQNKFIFWHLGLDVSNCNLSISEAAELIAQMKKDPKFVYDYLIQNYQAKVSDASKIQKAINKKERALLKTNNEKTKSDLCKEMYLADKTLTAKQIAQKVKCDLSVVYRALSGRKKETPSKTVSSRKQGSLKYRQVLNHIKGTPNLQGDNALTLENLAESYNYLNNTNYSINDFSRCMNMIVSKGYCQKIGKGLYSLEKKSDKVEKIEASLESKEKNISCDKAYEYAVALYKAAGKDEAHRLIDMVFKLTEYIG